MYKSFKFRLYPNKKQIEIINKIFGNIRFIYNYYLSKAKQKKYHNVYSNISNYTNYLKYEYSFLQNLDMKIVRKTLFNLNDNIIKYNNLSKDNLNYNYSNNNNNKNN